MLPISHTMLQVITDERERELARHARRGVARRVRRRCPDKAGGILQILVPRALRSALGERARPAHDRRRVARAA